MKWHLHVPQVMRMLTILHEMLSRNPFSKPHMQRKLRAAYCHAKFRYSPRFITPKEKPPHIGIQIAPGPPLDGSKIWKAWLAISVISTNSTVSATSPCPQMCSYSFKPMLTQRNPFWGSKDTTRSEQMCFVLRSTPVMRTCITIQGGMLSGLLHLS